METNDQLFKHGTRRYRRLMKVYKQQPLRAAANRQKETQQSKDMIKVSYTDFISMIPADNAIDDSALI